MEALSCVRGYGQSKTADNTDSPEDCLFCVVGGLGG